MSSQHRYPNKNYRPAPTTEYDPAKKVVESAGHNMDRVVRAFLRWLNEDPTRLALLDEHLKAIEAETPRGRPNRDTTPKPGAREQLG